MSQSDRFLAVSATASRGEVSYGPGKPFIDVTVDEDKRHRLIVQLTKTTIEVTTLRGDAAQRWLESGARRPQQRRGKRT